MSNITNRPSLTRDGAVEIAGALQKIVQLESTKIKTSTSDQELSALRAWLAGKLQDHCAEFLGAWFTIANEYEPLLNLYARVQLRAAQINQQYLKQPQIAPIENGGAKES